MKQDAELADIKLALAALSAQLDAMAARRSETFAVPSDPPDTKSQNFALRAVLAMRHLDEKSSDY